MIEKIKNYYAGFKALMGSDEHKERSKYHVIVIQALLIINFLIFILYLMISPFVVASAIGLKWWWTTTLTGWVWITAKLFYDAIKTKEVKE